MRVRLPYLKIWLATFKAFSRYFRYEVEGFEHLRDTRSALVVGYHGGPWAFDLFMLSVRMYEELGYFHRLHVESRLARRLLTEDIKPAAARQDA